VLTWNGTAGATKPVDVIIADDHALFRRGVRSLLSTVEGVEVVAEVADGESAIALTAELTPHLVLMDLQMPGGGGLAAIRELTELWPEVNVLVITMFEDDDSVFAAMRAGARGYVLKSQPPSEVADAVRQAARGVRRFLESGIETLHNVVPLANRR